jgi:hypothetical protein
MDTTLLFILIWLAVGLTSEIMAYQIKSIRDNYWMELPYHVFYFILSPLYFYTIFPDFKQELRSRKRQDEVVEILNGIKANLYDTLLWPDRLFIQDLYNSPEYGKINDTEYTRLINLVEGYKLQNVLNVN